MRDKRDYYTGNNSQSRKWHASNEITHLWWIQFKNLFMECAKIPSET